MLLVEERGDDGVQTNGLTLTGGTCHEEVGHLAEVEHEYLIRDGLADSYGQLIGRLLELAAVDDRVHRHHLRIGIGNLYTDSALAGYGGDDTGTEGGKRQGDVVF